MKAKIFLMTMFAALTIGAMTVSAEENTELTENNDPIITTVSEQETIALTLVMTDMEVGSEVGMFRQSAFLTKNIIQSIRL